MKNARKVSAIMITLMVLTTGSCLAAKVKIVHSAHPDHGSTYRQFVEDAKVDFEKKNPDIEIEVVTGTTFDKTLTMAAAGVAPDILDGSTTTAYSYYSAGLLLDLQPLIEKDKSFNINELIPPAVSGYQVGDTLFGVPISIYQVLCFYNRDLFLEAGIADPGELGENWTWESAIAAGKRLTRDLDSDGNLDQWGVEVNNSFYRWPIFVHQAGGLLFDRIDEPTESNFNSPAGRAGLGFLTDLFVTHNIAFDIHRMWDGYKFFYAGKIGFSLVDGPSLLGSMPREVGDRFEWDVSQLPKGPDNNGTLLIMNGFQVSSQCDNPEAAWRWVKHLISKEWMLEFMTRTGRTPSRQALLREIPRTLAYQPQHLEAVADAVLNPASMPLYLTPILRRFGDDSASMIMPALRGEKSVNTVLEELDKRATVLLSELK